MPVAQRVYLIIAIFTILRNRQDACSTKNESDRTKSNYRHQP
ncbi:MAG: hypothetical protein QQW96_19720 [Tychonema bourrellyi B0820]|nr:hypothetical protein [Tychonema bourrellyi]MDQ2099865.1 hypothetical protein [Tychonema bourrellyi B0820]